MPGRRFPWMPAALRRSLPLLLLISLVTLTIFYVKASLNPDTKMMAGMVDLRGLTPNKFEPTVVVGRFYVENMDDPQTQILLSESKKVSILHYWLSYYFSLIDHH